MESIRYLKRKLALSRFVQRSVDKLVKSVHSVLTLHILQNVSIHTGEVKNTSYIIAKSVMNSYRELYFEVVTVYHRLHLPNMESVK